MGNLQNIGQLVSISGAISLFTTLPSGSPQQVLQREVLVPKARLVTPSPPSVRAAMGLAHASTMPPTVFAEVVTAAPDSGSARYAQLASLWDRVEGFVRMPNGWAGEDTIAPAREIADDVGVLLSELPQDLELPQATASGEGEIGLTWFKGDDRLDAIIAPDGYLTWVSKVGDEFLDGGVLVLSSHLFDPLYEALANFYG